MHYITSSQKGHPGWVLFSRLISRAIRFLCHSSPGRGRGRLPCSMSCHCAFSMLTMTQKGGKNNKMQLV